MNFHGENILQAQYDALNHLTRREFRTEASKYFKKGFDCGYRGIKVKKGYITSLTLIDRTFHEIPDEICQFTFLEKLSLKSNYLTKFDRLLVLLHLKDLDLSEYRIRNISNLHQIESLERVVLTGNPILSDNRNRKEYELLLKKKISNKDEYVKVIL